ncbi:hypothetical protein I553_1650 [Mycobacterium xenopi 4042]|uniref:Uncharacterized protein n=1 Tax=Mycobacterium xenopi 4042 TaxID=1299334 RepID=X8CHI7_MYCXE|nr:hypothetical protein I553_1650 [Mycobacterium xenopi 4042]
MSRKHNTSPTRRRFNQRGGTVSDTMPGSGGVDRFIGRCQPRPRRGDDLTKCVSVRVQFDDSWSGCQGAGPQLGPARSIATKQVVPTDAAAWRTCRAIARHAATSS